MNLNEIPLLDEAAIVESKALMEGKFDKIVAYFLEDSATYVGQIEQAFATANLEALVPPAHTLKSSSRQMGAKRLSSAAEHIERTARELIKQGGSIDTLRPTLEPLKAVLAETIPAYK